MRRASGTAVHFFLSLLASILIRSPLVSAGSLIPPTTPGVFFVFASGQVVVIDPSSNGGKYNPNVGFSLTSIRTAPDSNVPFPNQCTGSTFRGRWTSASLGPGGQSIFATARYETPLADRTNHFTDGLYVVSTFNCSVETRRALDGQTGEMTFAPYLNSVWLSTNAGPSSGPQLAVFSAMDPVAASAPPLSFGSVLPPAGTFTLIHDNDLGSKGYLFHSALPGVFAINAARPYASPAAFINFGPMASRRGVLCAGITQGVYSRVLRHIFLACSATPGPLPPNSPPKVAALFQVDTRTNAIVNAYDFTGKLVLTPDDAFLLVVDQPRKAIHVLQLNVTGTAMNNPYQNTPNVTMWQPMTLSTGVTPADIAFAVYPPRYLAYVSVLEGDSIGFMDFDHIYGCGPGCESGNMASFIQFTNQMNLQNPQNGPIRTWQRPLATGWTFVCQAADHDAMVVCIDSKSGIMVRFGNITGVDHILFVPGAYNGPFMPDGGADTFVDCSTIPTSVPMWQTPPPPPVLFSAGGRTLPAWASLLGLLALGMYYVFG